MSKKLINFKPIALNQIGQKKILQKKKRQKIKNNYLCIKRKKETS
jgi:hypothetical protein